MGNEANSGDLRDIDRINVHDPLEYEGQYALFELTKETFKVSVDCLGIHQVYHSIQDDAIYCSNNFELMQKTPGMRVDKQQILIDFLTTRYGFSPGYNSFLKGCSTLHEFGRLKIEKGKLQVSSYAELEYFFTNGIDFHSVLNETAVSFRHFATYLRKYHITTIGLSGGFDGRLILSAFSNTSGNHLETYTYNRAGFLDFLIAGLVSRSHRVINKKIRIPHSKTRGDVINTYKNSREDPFQKKFFKAMADFYKTENSYKVFLGGNGLDIDFKFGERVLGKVEGKDFNSFVREFSKLLVDSQLLSKETVNEMASTLEKYFLQKYFFLQNDSNWRIRFFSCLYHFERIRPSIGPAYSQILNEHTDFFMFSANKAFLKCVFAANYDQKQRNRKAGIHYQLSKRLNPIKTPFIPFLTSSTDFADNILQKLCDKIVPTLPKIIWKLNNGDTTQKARNLIKQEQESRAKDYILKNSQSALWESLDYSRIIKNIEDGTPNFPFYQIATMVKSLDQNKI